MLKTVGFDRVRLISVVDSKKDRGDAASIEAYLEEQSAKVGELGMQVETRVGQGDAAEVLVAAANEEDVDLVLIATHGRTGIARLRLGSVGEKLIKDASCPRLVVGPNVEIDLEHYSLKRLLVPLDGSDLAEASLPIARYIAGLTGAEVELLRAVSPTSAAPDPTLVGADFVTPMIDDAHAYLARMSEAFPNQKTNGSVALGPADGSILEHLKAHPVDLVIMGSRGRTGLTRFALGSVTERVLQGPDPVLVFEAGEDRGRFFQAAREASGA
jgi:nucleotide-binding universal stress UspA family protein